jgi:hypothetical protein
LTTIYLDCAPEKNKAGFEFLYDREVALVKKQFPAAKYVGLADGTHRNWEVLTPMSNVQVQDFFHVAEYLKKFGEAAFGAGKKSTTWQEKHRTLLLDQAGGAQTILDIMREKIKAVKPQARKKKYKAPLLTLKITCTKWTMPSIKNWESPSGRVSQRPLAKPWPSNA